MTTTSAYREGFMATCCTGHGDSGRIRFSRDYVSGWPRSERQGKRKRKRRRIGSLIVTGIASKLDHSWRLFRILLIPGIAVARYRTCAHPACTPRENSIRGMDNIDVSHCGLSLSLSLSVVSLAQFRKIDLLALGRPRFYRRNLCAPIVTKMHHLLAARASVSVHLLVKTLKTTSDERRLFKIKQRP